MATYSREQLYRMVLQELGELDQNEAPEAEDYLTVRDRTQQVMELLYEDGLIPFDVDTTAIPARYFIPLSWKVAASLLTVYSASDRVESVRLNEAKADKILDKLAERQLLDVTTQADYF